MAVVKSGGSIFAVFLTVWLVLCLATGIAVALPSGRAYELVSPVFKGGFGAIGITAASTSGESVAYYSPGVFAGAPASPTSGQLTYIARRGASGWSTMPLLVPASLIAQTQSADVSPSLGQEFAIGYPGVNLEDKLPVARILELSTSMPDEATNWDLLDAIEPVGQSSGSFAIQELGADQDFCKTVLMSGGVPLLPEAVGAVGVQLYELSRGCSVGESPSLKLVGIDNKGGLINSGCSVDLGISNYTINGANTYNAISSDGGGEVFFTDCLSGSTKVGSPHQLFVRMGGVRSVEVSRPLVEPGSKEQVCVEVPCEEALLRASAEFQGASEDGSRVFFTAPLNTGQALLVPGDTDVSNNLYMASIGCPAQPGCSAVEREVKSLVEVSNDPNSGGAAEVQGVVRVAPDGQRVYFVARGDLLSLAQQQALLEEKRSLPQVGADNLYVYDTTGSSTTTSFIGDLCSGQELSSGVEDNRCPGGSDASLWSSDAGEAQTAGADGRFLVFSTFARLTGDDMNSARDVYRYDASTGVLERVSVGEDGYDDNGNKGLAGASILFGHHGGGDEQAPVSKQYEMDHRAVSEDGSRIVFVSADPLSPSASNGLANVYEWHEAPGGLGGNVTLVSSGSGVESVEDVVISPSGVNVFFDTAESLVPQDVDGAPDVYDARLEGPGEEFAPAPAERRPCEGDGCQGPLTTPAPLLVPGSVSQAPEQDGAPSTSSSSSSAAAKHPTSKCGRGRRQDKHGKCVKAKKASSTLSRRASRSASNGGGRS